MADKRNIDDPYDRDVRSDPFLAEYETARDLVKQDPNMGVNRLEELSYKGSILSILYIADSMRTGWVYEQDLPGAEKWYAVAVEAGSVRGLHGLALAHKQQGRYEESLAELERAVELNYPPAMNSLAAMHFYGTGVPEDRDKARKIWRRGIKMGHFYSKKHLAWEYMRGKYGPLRIFEGLLLLMNAAIGVFIIANKSIYTDRLR
jgi:TPR repeat protein